MSSSFANLNHASIATMANSSRLNIDNVICYAPSMITTGGFWEGVNPLDFALPVFILQLILVVLTTRLIVILLRPFRQPRVIAEIIGGLVLGKSVLGRIKGFGTAVFPQQSLLTLGTVANLGLILFIFLVGVEMDTSVFRRMGRRHVAIALSGMILPFCIGVATSFLFRQQIAPAVPQLPFLLFLGVALSVTAFPVLARILAETKLMNTDLGRTAMSAAIVNDLCAWVLLAVSVSLADSAAAPLLSVWVLLSAAAFVLLCFFAVRPAMRWAARRAAETGEGVTDFQLCWITVGLMLAALATDAIGVHAVFGAFVYGLVVPSGAMGKAVVEKLEDFVTGVLLPLFFVVSGLRTNVGSIKDPLMGGLLLVVFLIASLTKIAGTMVVALFYAMPIREGLALGFLMNTRGLVEMIILNIGRDRQVLDEESFAVMVLSSVIMTAAVSPVVTSIYRPSGRVLGYKRRTIQRSKPDAELRMLACLHSPRQIPPILALLSLSHPTKRSPVFLYALHLAELTGRASTLLAAASTCSSPTASTSLPSLHSSSPSPFISTHPLSAASPFVTMHEDVARIAGEKHAALILLPFHKHLTVDGDLEAAPNPAFRALNLNVLDSAPCSVAIFVDRGLASLSASRIAIIFLGGPHDREALAFAWRMADNPLTAVSLHRFLPLTVPRMLSVITDGGAAARARDDDGEERRADEEMIAAFRRKYAGNERVVYVETAVKSGEEVVTAVKGIDSVYDLYVVGRGYGGAAAELTAGLTEWAECPELGPIGDLITSSDFAASASVLVVQQYVDGTLGSSSPTAVERRSPAEAGGVWGRRSSFEIGWGGR